MTKEEIYHAWAPTSAPWTPWVKPVLFAHLDATLLVDPDFSILSPQDITDEAERLPPASDGVAVVLDLPSDGAVVLGLRLAACGYRPVPLYNAVPASPAFTARSAINVRPMLRALAAGAAPLAGLALPATAPPAFLLDADRRVGTHFLQDGDFDNRSISFPTDFPSALFLRAQGITSTLLVQRGQRYPQPDLAHTLRLWQQSGVQLHSLDIASPDPSAPLIIKSRSHIHWLRDRLHMLFTFRRHPLGGYGGLLPDPSASSS